MFSNNEQLRNKYHLAKYGKFYYQLANFYLKQIYDVDVYTPDNTYDKMAVHQCNKVDQFYAVKNLIRDCGLIWTPTRKKTLVLTSIHDLDLFLIFTVPFICGFSKKIPVVTTLLWLTIVTS